MRQHVDVSAPGVMLMVVCAAIGAAATVLSAKPLPVVIAVAIGLLFMFSVKVVRQWEKVAVLRFGRYLKLQGPGLFMIIPVVDTLSAFVDQRVRLAL
jgi:regulator of protease activity HflC (stomatin/prohibitin superfamily)